jgi:hypothetical protein
LLAVQSFISLFTLCNCIRGNAQERCAHKRWIDSHTCQIHGQNVQNLVVLFLLCIFIEGEFFWPLSSFLPASTFLFFSPIYLD